MNIYTFLADAIASIHLVYVSIVVFGLLAILIGWPLRWQWIRNPWFRIIHLMMIVIVAVEAVISFECPLTTWEIDLRQKAHPELAQTLNAEGLRERSFVGRLVGSLMFYDADKWGTVIDSSYYVVAGAILTTIFLIPPRFRRRVPGSALATSEPLSPPATPAG